MNELVTLHEFEAAFKVKDRYGVTTHRTLRELVADIPARGIKEAFPLYESGELVMALDAAEGCAMVEEACGFDSELYCLERGDEPCCRFYVEC